MTDDVQSESEVERGPNGFPYADDDGTSLSRWETGEYHLKVEREDGERVDVNLRESQLTALKKSIELVTPDADE